MAQDDTLETIIRGWRSSDQYWQPASTFGGVSAPDMAQALAAQAAGELLGQGEVTIRAKRPAPAPSLAGGAGAAVIAAAPAPAPTPAPAPKPAPRPRRTRPKTIPSRRPRPRTPAKPRIRIPVPEITVVARRLASRALGALALLPAYLSTLAALDRIGQTHWNQRLAVLPTEEEERDVIRESAQRRAARDARASREPVPIGEPTVVVVGHRPALAPTARAAPAVLHPVALAPESLGQPGLDYGLQPSPSPATPAPTRKPVSAPLPSPGLEPYAQPLATPMPMPQLQPQPQARAPAPARPAPLTPIKGTVVPLPGLGPIPLEELAKCPPCPGKPKPRKKREPRKVCRKGTYVEHAVGITKTPKETIPCQ